MKVIKAVRKKRGITQRHLCLRAGITEPTLWTYETKRLKRARPTTLLKIAKALNINPALLLVEVEELTEDEKRAIGL